MPAPVLLLDVDGVLHPLGPNSLPSFANLSQLSARADESIERDDEAGFTTRSVDGEFIDSCMAVLKRIVKESGCAIILSSTWREQACDRRCVDALLRRHGLPACAGSTPAGAGRAAEILAWVRDAPGAVRWCAVDDANITASLPAAHFHHVQGDKGLSPADGDAILAKFRALEVGRPRQECPS